MKLSGFDDVTVSELEWFELRVIQTALSEYFQTQMRPDGFLSVEGEVALGMMEKIQYFRSEAFQNKE
jgi:hypothetical protein